MKSQLALTSSAFGDLRRRASLTRGAAAAAGVAFFALLTAASARVAFPLPNTPVPVTLQTLAVVLAGATMGPWLGTASLTLYLLLGLTGMDVFASPRAAGAPLLTVTGGYLLGFILAQPLIGWLARCAERKMLPRIGRTLLASLAGHAIIFTTGVVWLGVWLSVGAGEALALGFWPFVPGTILKTLAAASLGPFAQSAWGRIALR